MGTPELRHLRSFVVVAEELNFTRAATRLHIAQPSLSVQIKELERLLGVTLLRRSTRRVELTPAGEAYLAGARAVLDALASAEDAARVAGRGLGGSLRVAVDADVPRAIREAIVEFQRRHPAVEMRISIVDYPDALDDLRAGTRDAAFCWVGGFDLAGLAAQVVRRYPVEIVVPTGHPLAGRTSVSPVDLAGCPLVIFERRRGPEVFDAVTGLLAGPLGPGRLQVVQLAAAGESVAAILDHLSTVENGFAVAPRGFLNGRDTTGMVTVPLSPRLYADLLVVWRESLRLASLDAFRAYLASPSGPE